MNKPKTHGEAGDRKKRSINENIVRQLGNDEIKEIFLPLKKNSSKEDFFGLLKNTIQHIHKLIKKDRMENEYIEQHLGKLSARDILTQQKTFYMNPCLDFVLVTIEGLKRIGIENINFVIDELGYPGGFYKLHFGIEIPYQGEKYYIDYRSKNDVFLGKGDFTSKYEDKGESIANTIKIDAQNISVDDNIYHLMNKGLLPFKFFDPRILELLKEKLKKDNNEAEWEGFREQIENIEQARIFIEKTE